MQQSPGLRHVIDIREFKDPVELDRLLNLARDMEERFRNGTLEPVLKGKILAALFYEPSTRTKFSFESAMKRLGGSVIETESAAQFSSAAKGESLPDTVRIVGRYADAIVIRHPEEGSAKIAAEYSPVPVINAGDGSGQHPTQTLLDVYTIKKEIGRLDGFTIAMAGDLKHGRTVHSLAYLLSHRKGVRMIFVSPRQLRMKDDVKEYLLARGVAFRETERLEDALSEADIIYMTRIQKERFHDQAEYDAVKGCCVITKKTLNSMKDNSIIMHPLPRVDEIAQDVDSDPRAAYFRQAENGLYVRMALLRMVLEGQKGLQYLDEAVKPVEGGKAYAKGN